MSKQAWRFSVRVTGVAMFAIVLLVARGPAEAVCTPLGTTTPNVGLCKPSNGEAAWTNAINDNWTILDNRLVPPGAVMFYAAATPPNGWYACDGSAKNRITDAALFAVISTTYGAGDGATTFNLPDARSRSVVAAGQGTGLTLRNLAATGGEETHALTVTEMPAHMHTFSAVQNVSGAVAAAAGGAGNKGVSSSNTGSTGGNGGHNVMDPFLVLTCMIKR